MRDAASLLLGCVLATVLGVAFVIVCAVAGFLAASGLSLENLFR